MDDASRALARFLFLAAVLLFCAEYLTKRTPATLRWCIMAGAWLYLVFILIWQIGLV